MSNKKYTWDYIELDEEELRELQCIPRKSVNKKKIKEKKRKPVFLIIVLCTLSIIAVSLLSIGIYFYLKPVEEPIENADVYEEVKKEPIIENNTNSKIEISELENEITIRIIFKEKGE